MRVGALSVVQAVKTYESSSHGDSEGTSAVFVLSELGFGGNLKSFYLGTISMEYKKLLKMS